MTEDGGFGSSLVKGSLQATTGALGVAFVHTVRGVDSVLNGQTYVDASGLSYKHIGTLVSVGNYGKAAGPVGNWNVSLLFADSHTISRPIPTYFDGMLPAGDGPGATTSGRSLNVVATANGLVGSTAISASVSSFDFETADSEPGRVLNLIPSPLALDSTIHGTDFTVSAQRSVSARTSVRATLTQTGTAVRASSSDSSAAGALGQSSSTVTLRSDTRITNALKAYAIASLTDADSAGWSPGVSGGFTLSASNGSHFSGLVGIGRRLTVAQDPHNEQGFLDPSSATYDCANKIATIPAPGATRADASYLRASLAYAHDTSSGYVSLAAYYDQLNGAMLTDAVVPLSEEPAGFVSASYADSLLAGFQRFARCGGIGIGTNDIFFIQDVSGVASRNASLSISGSHTIAQRLVASFGALLSSATLVGGDMRVGGPTSPYQFGRQIPGRPFVKADLVLDYAPTRLPEVLVDAEYLGANNGRYLPPNTTFNVGIEKVVSRTVTLNVIATNILNRYAGAFITARNAEFVPTQVGLFPSLAAPYPPASVHVVATFTLDRRREP